MRAIIVLGLGLTACGFNGNGNPDVVDGAVEPQDMPGAEVLRDVPHVPPAFEVRVATDVSLTGEVTIDTTTMTISPAPATTPQVDPLDQPSGPGIMLLRANAFSVAAGANVVVRGARALVILADTITITGALDAGAAGSVGGAGAVSTEGNGLDGTHHATFHDGGGGGGAFGQNGAPGGAAGTGATCGDGLAAAGAGGATFGDVAHTILQGGSRGGVGSPGPCTAYQPGAGGGAIQLSAWTRLDIAGTVNVGGGGGQGGHYCNNSDSGAGNGGGAGGALLLDAPTILLGGTLAANGGGGGGGASGAAGRDGNPGTDASATTMQPAGGSGIGSDGETGGKGAANSAIPSPGTASQCNGNGGGGGGGAGYVLVRSQAVFAPTGTSSPAAHVVTF